MQTEGDFPNARYDPGSKLWTFVLGLMVAGLVDWFAVAVPARSHPRHQIHTAPWSIALIIAMLAPAAWLVGRVVKKDWDGMVIWTCATALAVVAQVVVVVWGRG